MKKILPSIISTTILLSMAIPALAETNSFTDISGSFAKDAIIQLQKDGVLTGMDAEHFDPKGTLTRAQFIVIMVKSLKLPIDNKAVSSFTDVEGWAVPYVEAAKKYGIIDGMGDGTFAPNGTVTREQTAVIMVKALQKQGKIEDTAELTFIDKDSISDWAKKYVALAFKYKLVSGNPDGSFNPQGNATREQAAQMGLNFIKSVETVIKDNKPTPTSTPTPTVAPTPSATPAPSVGGGGGGGSYIPTPTATPTPAQEVPTVTDGKAVFNNGTTVEGLPAGTSVAAIVASVPAAQGIAPAGQVMEFTFTGNMPQSGVDLLLPTTSDDAGLSYYNTARGKWELQNNSQIVTVNNQKFVKATVHHFSTYAPIVKSAQLIADSITKIEAPAKDATSLALPTVETGYTVAINSSDNTGVIDLDGKITLPAAETTVAIVLEVTRTSDGSKAVTASFNVVVPAKTQVVSVTGVSLDQATMNLTVGGSTGTLLANVTPTNAANKAVTWSTSDGSVATVTNGVVTPIAAGTAIITVTTADGSFTATSNVQVVAAPVNNNNNNGISIRSFTQPEVIATRGIQGQFISGGAEIIVTNSELPTAVKDYAFISVHSADIEVPNQTLTDFVVGSNEALEARGTSQTKMNWFMPIYSYGLDWYTVIFYDADKNPIGFYQQHQQTDFFPTELIDISMLNPTSSTYAADVAAARHAYDQLSDAQKALITNYDALLAAEAGIVTPTPAPVALSNIHIQSNSQDPKKAIVGDTVTVQFTTTEAVYALSTFSINGSPLTSFTTTVTGNTYHNTASHVIDTNDQLGVMTFQINVKNGAGNLSQPIEATTDGSSVTVVPVVGGTTPDPTIASVTTEQDLKTALANTAVTTIKLKNDLVLTDDYLQINRAVTIDGQSDGQNFSINKGIAVEASNVVLRNLKITPSKFYTDASGEWYYGVMIGDVTGVRVEDSVITGQDGIDSIGISDKTGSSGTEFTVSRTSISIGWLGVIVDSLNTTATITNNTITDEKHAISLENATVAKVVMTGNAINSPKLLGDGVTTGDGITLPIGTPETQKDQLLATNTFDVAIVNKVVIKAPVVANPETILTNPTLTVYAPNLDQEWAYAGKTYAPNTVFQVNVNLASGTTNDFKSAAVKLYDASNTLVATDIAKDALLTGSYKGLSDLFAMGDTPDASGDPNWNIGGYSSSNMPTKVEFRLVDKNNVMHKVEAPISTVQPTIATPETLLSNPTLTVYAENLDKPWVYDTTTTYPANTVFQANVNFANGSTSNNFQSAIISLYDGDTLLSTNIAKKALLTPSYAGLTDVFAIGDALNTTDDSNWYIGGYSSTVKPTKAVFKLTDKNGVLHIVEAPIS